MNRIRTVLLALGLLALALPAAAQSATNDIKIVSQEQLIQRLQGNKDSLLVVNFWATWCKPCVEEMPHFTKLADAYRSRGVKVLLVSNDLTRQVETLVKPFIERNKLSSEVVVVNQLNANAMIDKVNELAKADWSGSIPATLIVDKQGKFVAFHEGEFTYETLTKFVDPQVARLSNR